MSLDVRMHRIYHISYDNGKTLEVKEEEVYNANITHNLGKMAEKAGLYEALWRPYRLKTDYVQQDDYVIEGKFEGASTTLAEEISPIIEKGLQDLKNRPDYFRTFDSENGWGIYDHFVPFVEKYLTALKSWPEAIITTDR
jgi:hypothetical protein